MPLVALIAPSLGRVPQTYLPPFTHFPATKDALTCPAVPLTPTLLPSYYLRADTHGQKTHRLLVALPPRPPRPPPLSPHPSQGAAPGLSPLPTLLPSCYLWAWSHAWSWWHTWPENAHASCRPRRMRSSATRHAPVYPSFVHWCYSSYPAPPHTVILYSSYSSYLATGR